jgi:tRNA(Ile)-lysidine synthase TilS/MesJ
MLLLPTNIFHLYFLAFLSSIRYHVAIFFLYGVIFMRKVLGCLRKAVTQFDLIQPGDRIAVGVSGGKDSMALLYALKLYQRFSPVPYELEGIMVDMGFDAFNTDAIVGFAESIDVPFTITHTQISDIIFNVRKEKNPCALCAKMRKGALHDAALERNCNVIALGHHADDAIETFFMSLFYEGRLHTLQPKTYLSRKNLYSIRPLIFAKEKEIIGAINKSNIPVAKSKCPADGNSKRSDMKAFSKNLYRDYPRLQDLIISAFQNEEQTKFWF